jgi:hypothetical protein
VVGVEQSYEYFEDGLLLVEDGQIAQVGHAADLLPTLKGVEITEYPDALITPGFIDTHIHYPQTGMIASYGEQLLDWLNTYTFPTERQFEDKAHAADVAGIFLKELLRNGTTTALVFGSVHKQSVDAFFEAAEALNLRMIAGKVLMVALGGVRTVTVNGCVALIGGEPLSVTRTVMLLTLGACAGLGVQVNTPAPVMFAPSGAPVSRLKVSVCAGKSASLALFVKVKVWPRVTVRSTIAASVGGVLPRPMVLAVPGVGVVMK